MHVQLLKHDIVTVKHHVIPEVKRNSFTGGDMINLKPF